MILHASCASQQRAETSIRAVKHRITWKRRIASPQDTYESRKSCRQVPKVRKGFLIPNDARHFKNSHTTGHLINGFRQATASAVPLELRKSWASAPEAPQSTRPRFMR